MSPKKRKPVKSGSTSQDKPDGPAVNDTKHPSPNKEPDGPAVNDTKHPSPNKEPDGPAVNDTKHPSPNKEPDGPAVNDTKHPSPNKEPDGPAVNDTKHPSPNKDMVDDASIPHRRVRDSQHQKLHNPYEEFDDISDSSLSEEDERSIHHLFKISLILFIIGITLISAVAIYIHKEIPTKTDMLIVFMDDMKKLYPTQDPNMWEYVKVQFEGVKHLSRPAVFMVAHYNHQGEAVEVVGKMGRFAAEYLNNGTEEMKPVIANYQELDLRDHGELLTRYKSKFIQNRVMIIDSIEKVPGVVAQGFRYFCDEFTPMVEKSVMFFTVNLHSCKNSVLKMDFRQAESGSLTEIIEDCLTDSWKSQLDPHVLHPVLTRVVSNVLKIL